MALAATHFRSPSLLRGFNTWAEAADETRTQTELMRRSIGALRSVSIRRAVNQWASVTDLIAGLKGLMSSMKDHSTRRAFNTWEANAVAEGERQSILHRPLASLLQLRERRAFNSWSEFASAHSAAQQSLRSAVSAFRLAGARKAVNTWWAVMIQRVSLRRAIAALVHSGTRAGFSA